MQSRLRESAESNDSPVVSATGDYLIDDLTIEKAHTPGAIVKCKPLWLDDLVETARTLVQLVAAQGLTSGAS